MALTIEKLCACIEELQFIAGDGRETVRCICVVEGMRSAALAERDCLVLPLCSGPLTELIDGLAAAAILVEETQIDEVLLEQCRAQEISIIRYCGTAEEIEQKCRIWMEEEAQQEWFGMLAVQVAMCAPMNDKLRQIFQKTYHMEQFCLTAIELRTAEGQPLSHLRCLEVFHQLRYDTRRSEVPIIWLTCDGLIYSVYGGTDIEARCLMEQVARCAPDEQIRIAVSRTVTHMEDLPILRRHVRLMLRLLWANLSIGTVCSYRDLGMYQVLMSTDDPEAMRELYKKTLEPLVLYDEKNGTNYVELLHCYLSHDAGVSATAAALFLHRNSVNYKLNRIQEILGCSLSRQTVRSRLLIAFMIRDIL